MSEAKRGLDDFFGEEEPEDLLPSIPERSKVPATVSPQVVDSIINEAVGIVPTQAVSSHLQKHLVDLLQDMKSLDKDTTYRGLLAKHQLRKTAVDMTTRLFEIEAGEGLDSRVLERVLHVVAKTITSATYIPPGRKKQILSDLKQSLKMNVPEIVDVVDTNEETG